MSKIFLDNNSTTPIDPEVLESMIPFFKEKFGNSSSKTHSFGWEAEAAVEIAREKVSELINCNPSELILTSGATESNNIAILSALNNSQKKHIITMRTEHKAVLDICKYLEKNGVDVTYLTPNKDGLINIDKLIKAINNDTILISVMHANNEIGVLQPIKKIGEICKKHNILFHVDAAQSLGKTKIDLKKLSIDLLSLSSHKIYGPKGIGALYINKNRKILPIMYGGNQEKSIRPGTIPVPLVVGFGKACEIVNNIMHEETIKILELRTLLLEKIVNQIPDTIVNGNINDRIAGNLNLTFPKLNGQSIVTSIPKLAISSGSACTSSSPEPSHVLLSLGLNKKLANSSIRIGIGRFNTKKEISIAAEEIINIVNKKIITL